MSVHFNKVNHGNFPGQGHDGGGGRGREEGQGAGSYIQ